MKGFLAVFDVDGTLFRRGLLPALTRRLVNEGIFSERVREELSRDYYDWVERRGSYDTYDGLVVDLFLRELEGVTVLDLQRCARAEVEAHGRRLHMYTHDMAARLKLAGYQLIAISGSPQEILDLFLTPLGFDRSWGTVLAQDARGCYTGEVLHYPFKNERQVLEGFLNDVEVGLEGSVGMGDSLRRRVFGVGLYPHSLQPQPQLFRGGPAAGLTHRGGEEGRDLQPANAFGGSRAQGWHRVGRITNQASALRNFLQRGVDRLWDRGWPILQTAVAVGLAWYLASVIFGHEQPVFASIAALISLGVSVGRQLEAGHTGDPGRGRGHNARQFPRACCGRRTFADGARGGARARGRSVPGG